MKKHEQRLKKCIELFDMQRSNEESENDEWNEFLLSLLNDLAFFEKDLNKIKSRVRFQ
ncbi:MAG: hypothetical protein LBS39_04815 [Campylobacteraceae bacterium]|nr:hypothetical protein [Campylobacteraceae bacterium]